ncbi:hypothetical protein LC609_26770 [Nostoc sp. XA013]|nr:hypothetical protein [Nostoc sp. XA013]
MSQCTNSSIPENVIPALMQLKSEVEKVENTLLELRQEKQEFMQRQLSASIQKIATIANNINTLANSIESEIFNFQATALEVNHLYHTIQTSPIFKALQDEKSIIPPWIPINIREMDHPAIFVPTVIRSKSQFVLTAKSVDIHKQEIASQQIDIGLISDF